MIKNKKRDLNRLRYHSHFTRKFRGAAHCICNLRYKVPYKIPVKIHNGLKYDYHLIIKELAEEFRGEDFECLGKNTAKYISFSVLIKKEHDNDSSETITYKTKFIVSCRFMASKLSNLVDSLSEINNKDCKTCIERKNIKSECEFIGFNETSLPPKEDFYSELISELEDISDKDYENARKVSKEYCKDIGAYHDLYVQTDTLLLADVLEKF